MYLYMPSINIFHYVMIMFKCLEKRLIQCILLLFNELLCLKYYCISVTYMMGKRNARIYKLHITKMESCNHYMMRKEQPHYHWSLPSIQFVDMNMFASMPFIIWLLSALFLNLPLQPTLQTLASTISHQKSFKSLDLRGLIF